MKLSKCCIQVFYHLMLHCPLSFQNTLRLNVIPVHPQGALLCSLIREPRNQLRWKWWRRRPHACPRTLLVSKRPPRWRSPPWRGRDKQPDLTNSSTVIWTCLLHQDSENHFLENPSDRTHCEPVAGLPLCSPVLSCCSVAAVLPPSRRTCPHVPHSTTLLVSNVNVSFQKMFSVKDHFCWGHCLCCHLCFAF